MLPYCYEYNISFVTFVIHLYYKCMIYDLFNLIKILKFKLPKEKRF